jgi:methionyl-tRNA formyltransferase
MRIVFMGTPDFAVPSLQALLEAGYTVVGVYTQPPRPKGRGYGVQPSPVQAYAQARGLPVLTPTTLRDAASQGAFKALQPTLAVVAAYGLILPKTILQGPTLGCVNIHASLLPRWRGAAPLQRAILAGDSQTGVCIMQMEEGLDTGPVWARTTCPITPVTTTTQLHHTLAALGASLLIDTLPTIIKGHTAPTPQPDDGVTYATKITKADGLIDWNMPAVDMVRCLRALSPWPGVYFECNGTPFKIREAQESTLPLGPGMVHQTKKELIIGCGQGSALQILSIQKQGGTPLSAEAFNNGFTLPPRLKIFRGPQKNEKIFHI